jgi:uncharacterized protein (TIGR03435 family)
MPIARKSRPTTASLLLATVSATLFAPLAFSQTIPYTPKFTFDVVSVHENTADPSGGYPIYGTNSPDSSKYSAINFTARDLITVAYGIQDFRISGGPDWLTRARFTVEAKSDASTDDALARLSIQDAWLEKQHMLQVLLADRFHLRVHWATKDLPGFALVVAKGGPKMQNPKDRKPSPDEPRYIGDSTIPHYSARGDGYGGFELIGRGASMEGLAATLAGQFKITVVDKTSLTGTYDFTLQFNGTVTARDEEDGETYPPLITAIQKQLGLKLKPTKVPTPVLIIDHLERPTEN